MALVYREYGKTIEITTYERKPSEIRLPGFRSRRVMYGARRSDSFARTRTICVRRVSVALEKFGVPLFITLTLKGDASNAAYANSSLGRFQVRLRSKFPGCQSIFVPELSPRGRIHFHGLLFRVPLSLGDIREGRRIISYGSERSDRTLAKLYGAGFVDALQTDGSERLAYYIAKYITKAGSNVLFNAMHLLRISQGFPRDFVARDEYGEYWMEKMGVFEKLPRREWSVDNPYLGTVTKQWFNK